MKELQNAPKINISIDKTTAMVCEACGNETFQEVLFIRKVSKIFTGSNQDSLIPIPTFCCAKCKHVNDDLYPQELKTIQ